MTRVHPADANQVNVNWRFLSQPDPTKVRWLMSGTFGKMYLPPEERARVADFEAGFSIAYSEDGEAWDIGVIPGFDIYGDPWFIRADGRTLMMGGWFHRYDDGTYPPDNCGLLVSQDGGSTWEQPAFPVDTVAVPYLGAVGNGRFVVSSWHTPHRVYTCSTSDPTSWSVATVPGLDLSFGGPYDLQFMDGRFLMMISSPTRIALSDDGISWDVSLWPYEPPGHGKFVSDGTRWLSTGSGRPPYVSYDRGETWTQANPSNSFSWAEKIVYHAGLYVAGTSRSWPLGSGLIRTGLLWSNDGLTWTNADPDPFKLGFGNALDINVWDVLWDGDQWWAVGRTFVIWEGGGESYVQVAKSEDGKAWEGVNMYSIGPTVATSIVKLPPGGASAGPRGEADLTGNTVQVRAREDL